MKLYWGRHTCAIGIHALLEEAGATFETEELDVAGNATRRELLEGRAYVGGARFSIGDTALFHCGRRALQFYGEG